MGNFPMGLSRGTRSVLAAAAAAVALSTSAGAAEDPWKTGAAWVTLRGGYVKSMSGGAPSGVGGYGFGYSRMLSNRVSFGMSVQHDLLGRFGGASLIELPITAEYAWHFHWKTPLHPYVGLGVGAVYHKVYRSGADRSSLQPASIVKLGIDTPLDRSSVLGLDARISSVSSDDETLDPVFGRDKSGSTRWSLKLGYSRVF